MIKINLLAPDAIKKEERNEILILAYALIAALFLIGLARYGLKYNNYRKLEARITKSQNELQKYEGIVKQVETLQATKTILETKKNVIDALKQGRVTYPRFLEEMLAMMPSNLWFKNMFTTSQPDGKIAIKLDAESLDNYAIADFITSLSLNPDFEDVVLGPINTTTSDKRTTSVFNLSFNYLKKKQ
ncbi:MAG: PilN domain-containing protein [Endomicrobiales bacterium]|nr:PilN domain-containing protein [Endomicrobiales bacterium]